MCIRDSLNLLSENKKPHGSIISSSAPRQEHVLIIEAVFCGISGSYKAIFGLKLGLSCVIVSLEKYFLIHI